MAVGGKWSTISLPVKILRCIKHTASHVADIPVVGIFSPAPKTVIIKTSVLAPFLGVKRNGLNKIFRDYGFNFVREGEPMAEMRTVLWPGGLHERGWSKRVPRGMEFHASMTEGEVLAIAHEMLAYRRIANAAAIDKERAQVPTEQEEMLFEFSEEE
jgi:hypothetical protein